MKTQNVEKMRKVQQLLKDLEELIADHLDMDEENDLSPEALVESALEVHANLVSDV